MSNYYQNVKITEGNEFSLLIPIKTRNYNENGTFVDEVIDARLLTECVVTFGNVEYEPRLLEEGVLINLPANLARATYSIIVTAKHNSVAIRAALFQAVTIVAWSYQSNAEQFLPNSPIVLDAAFVIRPYSQSEDAIIKIYAYLRQRLSGNAELGIPAKMPIIENGEVLDENLTNLDRYLHLLDDRKISGAPEVADGMSLVQLLCGSAASAYITTLTDTTTGWTMDNAMTWANFPNLTSVELGCSAIIFIGELNTVYITNSNLLTLNMPNLETIVDSAANAAYGAVFRLLSLQSVNLQNLRSTTGCLFWGGICPEELILPNLVTASRGIAQDVSGVKRIICPELTTCNGYSYNPNVLSNCPDLEYAYIPKLSVYKVYASGDGAGSLQDMPNLSHLVIGRAPFISSLYYMRYALDNCPNLVLLDIRGELNVNIYLDHWSPTTALSSNLLQFLSNFREFLFLRLADRTGQTALTLTLSSAVYTALTTETRTLAELGVTELTELEINAGITLDTPYNEWIDTYRAAINWTIAYV